MQLSDKQHKHKQDQGQHEPPQWLAKVAKRERESKGGRESEAAQEGAGAVEFPWQMRILSIFIYCSSIWIAVDLWNELTTENVKGEKLCDI